MEVVKNTSDSVRPIKSGRKRGRLRSAPVYETVSRYRPIQSRLSTDDVLFISEHANRMLMEVRNAMPVPPSRKTSPRFTPQQLQRLCGIDVSRYSYALRTSDLPKGTARESTGKRTFSLEEARIWFKTEGNYKAKPEDIPAKTIAISNFRGGVSKTSTAMNLAQGLTLLGRSCLLVDLDPQASLTALFGILPDLEIDEDQTILPYINDVEKNLEYAVIPTYWDGLELIPASSSLFSAEFTLPGKQTRQTGYRFWEVIKNGLAPLLRRYDVVIIDTPPALSYLSINAFMAADGIIVPIPPSARDYASSAQFWALFADFANSLKTSAMLEKTFDFIHVLLSKVNLAESAAPYVMDWIRKTYGHLVLPFEIPMTSEAEVSAAEFGTIYDMNRYDTGSETLLRARTAYDQFVLHMDRQLAALWGDESLSSGLLP